MIDDLTDVDNYNDEALLKLGKEFSSIDYFDTQGNEKKASFIITKIEQLAYQFLQYRNKYNKDKEIAYSESIKDIVLILDPEIYALISYHSYRQSFQLKYVELKEKFGIVCSEFDLPRGFKIIMFDRDTYKICPSLTHPNNNTMFFDESRYHLSLVSIIGYWLFCYQGIITYRNLAAFRIEEDILIDTSDTGFGRIPIAYPPKDKDKVKKGLAS